MLFLHQKKNVSVNFFFIHETIKFVFQKSENWWKKELKKNREKINLRLSLLLEKILIILLKYKENMIVTRVKRR